jgi:hypothetical protein
VVFTALSFIIPQADEDDPNPIGGVIKIVLGLLLLFLAVREWLGRPRGGEDAKLPKWMSAIDSLTTARGFVLGFVLAAINPKNLILAVGGGYAIGGAGLPLGSIIVVILIFALIAASTVLIPVLGFLIAGERAKAPLTNMRVWLVANNATIMAVVLLVLGVALIGKGIGSF